jgi:hypothetical protein
MGGLGDGLGVSSVSGSTRLRESRCAGSAVARSSAAAVAGDNGNSLECCSKPSHRRPRLAIGQLHHPPTPLNSRWASAARCGSPMHDV